MSNNYLIIGGTEKAGTTSVYQYLCSNPSICGSIRKETDYFRSPTPHDIATYESLFPNAQDNMTRMEASPGYLSESNIAAPAIAKLLPNAKILFILRDPIDRLLSGFDFHKSRFHIPQSMTFDTYCDLCFRFERGEIAQDVTGLKEWHLRVPDAGRYAFHLHDFLSLFDREQIRITTLDSLKKDPLVFMQALCKWSGLDSDFYNDYEFFNANVTFAPKSALIQKAGLFVNNLLEPYFNRNPRVKQHLLAWYKVVNGKKTCKPMMSSDTQRALIEYYSNDIAELIKIGGEDVSDANNWLIAKYA